MGRRCFRSAGGSIVLILALLCSLLYGFGHKVIEQLLESSSSCVSAAPQPRTSRLKVSASNSNSAREQNADDSSEDIEIIELLSSRSPSPEQAPTPEQAQREEPTSDSYDFEPTTDSTEFLTGDENSQEPASVEPADDSVAGEQNAFVEPASVATTSTPECTTTKLAPVNKGSESPPEAAISSDLITASETHETSASPANVPSVDTLVRNGAMKLESHAVPRTPQVFIRTHRKKQNKPVARGHRIATMPTRTESEASPDRLSLWYGESRHEIGCQPWTIHDWFMHGIQQKLLDDAVA